MICSALVRSKGFQSTPPVWGATVGVQGVQLPHDISIHAPRVGGDPGGPRSRRPLPISIHAPRVGGDRQFRALYVLVLTFQSTPPVWGATRSL